ncbi:MAG TPA: hypothetical protein VFH58_04945 [Acidimicrobiales bacterium]|nr:hypothetical protein [Acidimicrobiales bacterium]
MPTDTADPSKVLPTAARYVERLEELVGGRQAGLYLVGSPALGDLSPRQSNLDLVVVTHDPLPPGARRELVSAHRTLKLNGRQPLVCYTTFESLAKAPDRATATVYLGRTEVGAGELANPMTWAILAEHPTPLTGPAQPTVLSEPEDVRAWFAARLPSVVARTGSLLWRRQLTRVVLQVTRCAHGALTGEVLSLRQAGELALPAASHTSHRVITDALGYREGANTSMYWGPFERKANAGTLTQELLRKVSRAAGS